MMLSTDQKGAIAEAAITLAAVKLGIGVSRPLGDERYDLIFDIGDRLIRVQCKWASVYRNVIVLRCYSARRTAHGLIRTVYRSDEVDAFAAYCPELEKCYFIPFDQTTRSGQLQLRIRPTLNNQTLRIRWAEDYEFAATLGRLGAVAQLGERLDGIQKAAGSSPAGSTSEAAF